MHSLWMYGLDGHTKLMHCYQESLVGGPPWFGDLENSAFGLVTISKLLFQFTGFDLNIFSMFWFCASSGEYLF